MVDNFKNITENYILSPSRRERYLRIWETEGWALSRLGILSAGVAELVPPYRIERTDATHHVAIYTVSGSGQHVGGAIQPGSLFVYPTGQQLYWSDGNWDMIWFHVKTGRFPHLDKLTQPATLPFSEGEQLKSLMNGFCDEQVRRESHNTRAIENYSDLIAIHLERNLDGLHDPLRADTLDRLAAIWRMVEQDPSRPWSVSDLARTYGLSIVQFHRTVVEFTGTPPMRKVTEIRLNAACQMLLTSGNTLEVIAEAVGFASPYSLSRAFKRQFGTSPRGFRKERMS